MIDPYQPNLDKKTTPGLPPKKSNQWIVLCVVIALVSILYRLLALNAYNQSSLLFIGIPLFLSIALSLTPRPKSATGIIMKGITLSMLLFGILLIEGFICILIVSPLFYLIGGIVGFIMDRNAGKNIVNCSIIGVLLLMSAEGVTEWLSFSRDETVTITKPIDFSKKEARKLLASGPRFDMSELPLFLQLGFPHPESIEGDGISLDDHWTLHYPSDDKGLKKLSVKVTVSDENRIVLERVHDSSHIAHWMKWKSVEWQIAKTSDSTCNVQITLKYDRLLDPAWYFKPIERYGVRKAAEYFMSQTFKRN